MDSKIFQGRILHILPAKPLPSRDIFENMSDEAKMAIPFKKRQEIMRRQQAHKV